MQKNTSIMSNESFCFFKKYKELVDDVTKIETIKELLKLEIAEEIQQIKVSIEKKLNTMIYRMFFF